MKKIINTTLLVISSSLVIGNNSLFAETFVVKNIKIIGLKRVSKGTVYNYLPVQIGEEIDTNDSAEIVRSLYDTGFFQTLSLERQGHTLIINVKERGTIGEINIIGNKDIPSDKLKELLKEMGLVKGRVFQQASLEKLEKELKQAYVARGKYNAQVKTRITDLTDNRVAVAITISEGRVSRIKEIKFVGNHDFSAKELSKEMSLTSSGIFTYFTKKDQYSKPAMDASLEALRSFYLDRGYLKFKIVSSQVLLSSNKQEVFINIHLEEGPQYHFSGYAVLGHPLLSEDTLKTLIQVRKGQIFSRKKVTESISAIGEALGDKGFGFPTINTEPQVNEQDKTIFINFLVEPGRHVYVRRINFQGNTKTADYVLRNVIRQNEGSLLSLHNIKESERQLRILGYLKDINIKTTPVANTNNQIDLDIQVEEAPSAEASASLGYGTNGIQLNAALKQSNFMGTGRSVGFNFDATYWGQLYSFNYYNPFYTQTGMGRGFDIYYKTVDPKRLDISAYSSDAFGGDVNYNLLLSENSSFQFGYGYQDLTIKSVGRVQQVQNFVDLYGHYFREIHLTSGWNRNSYDQVPYPNKGTNQKASVLIALPVTAQSLSYYKASYQARWYQPITKGFIFTALGNVGYGNQFNNQGLPFFENYYAGGIINPGQVRGYYSYSLGPLDDYGNALGGNLLANASAGLILPYPLSRETIRTTTFFDAGNVYANNLPVLLRGSDSGPIRYSTGVSVEWRSPFGPLAFSVAAPLNKQPTDNTQIFQFTVSSGF